jgi:mono/diheme cytochrome c family protein
MSLLIRGLTLTGLLCIASAVTAGDDQRGKALHDGNCSQCHINISGGDGSGVYTRPDRRVTTLPGLKKQVQRCKASAGLAWNEQQIDDVTTHLNNTFYHIKAAK